LPAIRDPATAECAFTGSHTVLKDGVLVEAWRVSYLSWESVGGQLQPIRIRGYAARPVGTSGVPGIVQAHGLGGMSEESHATGLAALTGAFTLAYTGPGGGDKPENASEGIPATGNGGKRLFDTVPDPRGSWFWAHAVAGMRGLTCLGTRPEVDTERLGMTGFSAGGVVTTMSAGVDDRIKAAVPLSGTGAWGVAVQSPDAWQHSLLTAAGLDTGSPEWTTLLATIGADVLVAGANGAVLMVDGSTDEFFPLTALAATYDAVPGAGKRISIAANFDHGCYSLTGGESAGTIEERAALHAAGGQRMWFGHHFGSDASFSHLPAQPEVAVTAVGGVTAVTAVVDATGYDVESVRFWWSADDCFTFLYADLDETSGVWTRLAPATLPPNAVWFADVTYRTKDLLFPGRFALSSRPAIPAGFVPHIREIETCM
ncbi:MAG: acetylxylan esterase, partial [Deltaproteobacteria bacterium]|nr:acetylxylan esterase [Deltaproteobacteria bacterium]